MTERHESDLTQWQQIALRWIDDNGHVEAPQLHKAHPERELRGWNNTLTWLWQHGYVTKNEARQGFNDRRVWYVRRTED